MDPRRALGPLPEGIHSEVDDEGHLRIYARLDMLHLDADALHDRLAHWTQTDLATRAPHARAYVSFRHARPAAPEEDATLDLQEAWLGLEPTLALETTRPTEGEVGQFAALVPRFVEIIEGKGRPAGYRSPDVGTIE